MGKRHYFANGEKYCPKCDSKVSLLKFRIVNESRSEEESGRYHSRCKECENRSSKEYQLARKLKCQNSTKITTSSP